MLLAGKPMNSRGFIPLIIPALIIVSPLELVTQPVEAPHGFFNTGALEISFE